MNNTIPTAEQVERQIALLRSDQYYNAADLLESQSSQIATLTAERDRAVEILKLVADMDDGDVPALWNYSSILERARDFLAASRPSMPERRPAPTLTEDR